MYSHILSFPTNYFLCLTQLQKSKQPALQCIYSYLIQVCICICIKYFTTKLVKYEETKNYWYVLNDLSIYLTTRYNSCHRRSNFYASKNITLCFFLKCFCHRYESKHPKDMNKLGHIIFFSLHINFLNLVLVNLPTVKLN